MATSLQAFLASIDSRHTADEVQRRVDETINAFKVPPGQVQNQDEFRNFIICFYLHVDAAIMRRPQLLHLGESWREWALCHKVLVQAFGPRGDTVAFEVAHTGIDGGLRRVMRDMAQTMVDEYVDQTLSYKISQYWDFVPRPERPMVEAEYLHQFGHLLPPEIIGGGPGRLGVDFKTILQEHVNTVRRFRQVGEM